MGNAYSHYAFSNQINSNLTDGGRLDPEGELEWESGMRMRGMGMSIPNGV